MAVEEKVIERFLGGDPVEGNRSLEELVAMGDSGEELLFSKPISYPSTTQVRRRWLRYVASRKTSVAARLLDRMENQSRFRDGYAAACLFAGLPKDYSITDPLFRALDAGFKNVIGDYDSVRNLFYAWGHAGGDAATLWHFIKDNSFAWEKLVTFTFRAACVSFARMNGGDDWALEQLIAHQWRDFELHVIEEGVGSGIGHKAVDASELWMEANRSFLIWRRGEVADVILRRWAGRGIRTGGYGILARRLWPAWDFSGWWRRLCNGCETRNSMAYELR